LNINQLAQEISDMAKALRADRFNIDETSKLVLKEQKDGRFFIYLLEKGQKSRVIRRFAARKYNDAYEYCKTEQHIRIPVEVKPLIKIRVPRQAKVTLAQADAPYLQRPVETKVTLDEGEPLSIKARLHVLYSMMNRLATLAERVERLERELGVGESG
jgi:hypothetical protein